MNTARSFYGFALMSDDRLIYSSICKTRGETLTQIYQFHNGDAQDFSWKEIKIEVLSTPTQPQTGE